MQTWSIRENRLFADLDLTVRGAAGDSFLLLKTPAVLTEFKGDGLRISKVERDGQTNYYAVLERDGASPPTQNSRCRRPIFVTAFALPTGPAACSTSSLDFDQGGWDFASTLPCEILPIAGLAENHSGATLTLTPGEDAVIELRPRQRNLAAETTQFFAEVDNLYLPGPGVVNGYARVTVRPAQGRVAELELEVPKGFTVARSPAVRSARGVSIRKNGGCTWRSNRRRRARFI